MSETDLNAAVEDAVQKERQRCLEIALSEYVYWRNVENTLDSQLFDGITIGAVGAVANIVGRIGGALPSRA